MDFKCPKCELLLDEQEDARVLVDESNCTVEIECPECGFFWDSPTIPLFEGGVRSK